MSATKMLAWLKGNPKYLSETHRELLTECRRLAAEEAKEKPAVGANLVYEKALEGALDMALYAMPCANCPMYVEKKMCVPNDENTCMMPRRLHYLAQGVGMETGRPRYRPASQDKEGWYDTKI